MPFALQITLIPPFSSSHNSKSCVNHKCPPLTCINNMSHTFSNIPLTPILRWSGELFLFARWVNVTLGPPGWWISWDSSGGTQGREWFEFSHLPLCSLVCGVMSFLLPNLLLSAINLRTRVRPSLSTHTRCALVVWCTWCPSMACTVGKWLWIYKLFSVPHALVNTTAWAHRLYQISSHCKLIQSIITLKLLSLFLPLTQEHIAKRDSMNSSELWYSTVSHDVKHEASVIKTNNQTEYALVNVPKRKENIASTEEHSEYDYVLIT